MITSDKFFIEVDCYQKQANGQKISGDIYIQRRYNNRIILVIAEGEGGGIRANITAGVIASMCENYAIMEQSAKRIAESILRTFPSKDDSNGVKFTIIDIHDNGYVKILEFANPRCIILRRNNILDNPRECIEIDISELSHSNVYFSEFMAQAEDRLVFVNNGIINSGVGTRRMKQGWMRDSIISYLIKSVSENKTISAHQLCMNLIEQSEINDLFTIKNDVSCFSLYFRQPRQILVCTGPPFNDKKDIILADMVAKYSGDILICGGTTAQIISRELGREINVLLKRDPAGLPPTSQMEGVTLITEGVLTLSKVKKMLDKVSNINITNKGTDADVARMLLSHDIIEFVIGTRINPMHQDPNLPIELELRRNLVKSLAEVLETKFMKRTKTQYI